MVLMGLLLLCLTFLELLAGEERRSRPKQRENRVSLPKLNVTQGRLRGVFRLCLSPRSHASTRRGLCSLQALLHSLYTRAQRLCAGSWRCGECLLSALVVDVHPGY